jgi:DNA transformation protein
VIRSAALIAHLLELMRPTAEASSRSMFGGHGLYVDGAIVAIVVDDTLYFKTDDASRAEYAGLGLEPFAYAGRAGTRIVTNYRRAPEEALENPAAMEHWLRLAMAAALRAAKFRSSGAAPRPRKRTSAPATVAGTKARRKT